MSSCPDSTTERVRPSRVTTCGLSGDCGVSQAKAANVNRKMPRAVVGLLQYGPTWCSQAVYHGRFIINSPRLLAIPPRLLQALRPRLKRGYPLKKVFFLFLGCRLSTNLRLDTVAHFGAGRVARSKP